MEVLDGVNYFPSKINFSFKFYQFSIKKKTVLRIYLHWQFNKKTKEEQARKWNASAINTRQMDAKL